MPIYAKKSKNNPPVNLNDGCIKITRYNSIAMKDVKYGEAVKRRKLFGGTASVHITVKCEESCDVVPRTMVSLGYVSI